MAKHDFKLDTVLKKRLQHGFYQKARYNFGVISDSLIVSGPDIERHIMDARQTVSCRVNDRIRIIDICQEALRVQRDTLNQYNMPGIRIPVWQSWDVPDGPGFPEPAEFKPIDYNVSFELGDIAHAKSERFVDADLMGTIQTTGQALVKALRRQRKAFQDEEQKVFIFTVSMRNGGQQAMDLFWIANKLIPVTGSKCDIDPVKVRLTCDPRTRVSANGFRGICVHRYDHLVPERPEILTDLSLYYYHDDGGPMLTGMLVYI